MSCTGPSLKRARKWSTDMIEPTGRHNGGAFTRKPKDGDMVTWTMSGGSAYIAKDIGILISTKAGRGAENPLAGLKSLAER